MRPSSACRTGIWSVPATARSSSRSSGHGSTWRETKSIPSSVRTSRTAAENGHHSAWYSVGIDSATEAVLLVGAVAERFVRRAAAAAERSLFTLVEDAAFGVENPHAAGDEQWSVRRCAKLERLPTSRRR